MENIQTKPRVMVGRTKMDFPHKGKTLTAVHPFYGPAKSLNLLSQIRGSPENPTGYVEPTAPELISFVHKYFNGDEPQAKEVNQIMKRRSFGGFTGILYMPKEKIAHFIDYPKFDEESVVDRDNLLKRLDESRAQVPFKYIKESSINWRKVAKHPYFVAWGGGEEGAEKLAELASKHPSQEAYIWVPDALDLKESIARVARLYSSYEGHWLSVYSDTDGDYEDGHAFGVLKKVGEGTVA